MLRHAKCTAHQEKNNDSSIGCIFMAYPRSCSRKRAHYTKYQPTTVDVFLWRLPIMLKIKHITPSTESDKSTTQNLIQNCRSHHSITASVLLAVRVTSGNTKLRPQYYVRFISGSSTEKREPIAHYAASHIAIRYDNKMRKTQGCHQPSFPQLVARSSAVCEHPWPATGT